MPWNDSLKNIALDAAAAAVTHLSLHTAHPGTLANEVAGGSYARLAVSWDTAAGGIADDVEATRVFSVPQGVTAASFGFCTASTAGTVHGSEPIRDSEGAPVTLQYEVAGELALNDIKLNINGA